MDWNPLYDKLIVRREAERTKIGTMEVPDVAREKQTVGRVLRRGAGRLTQDGTLVPLQIPEGAEVLFNKFAGIVLNEDEPDVLVLREDEILAYRTADV